MCNIFGVYHRFVAGKQSAVFFAAPLAPEIIPPVTRVVTYSKLSRPQRAKSGSVQSSASDTGLRSLVSSDAGHGWTGGEFTPSGRPSTSDPSGSRTKRYSSQRLRNVGGGNVVTDSGRPHTALNDVPPSHLVNAATSVLHVPSRPSLSSPFYGLRRKFYVIVIAVSERQSSFLFDVHSKVTTFLEIWKPGNVREFG